MSAIESGSTRQPEQKKIDYNQDALRQLSNEDLYLAGYEARLNRFKAGLAVIAADSALAGTGMTINFMLSNMTEVGWRGAIIGAGVGLIPGTLLFRGEHRKVKNVEQVIEERGTTVQEAYKRYLKQEKARRNA